MFKLEVLNKTKSVPITILNTKTFCVLAYEMTLTANNKSACIYITCDALHLKQLTVISYFLNDLLMQLPIRPGRRRRQLRQSRKVRSGLGNTDWHEGI